MGGLREVLGEPLVGLAVVQPPELPIKHNLGKLTVLSVLKKKRIILCWFLEANRVRCSLSLFASAFPWS